MGEKRRKPDWRTNPRDEFSGMPWVTYLVCHYPKGYDWQPDEIDSRARTLHSGRRTSDGRLSDLEGGKPRMLPEFMRWLMREERSPITRERVQQAINTVRRRWPDEVEALAYRQRYGPYAHLTPAQFSEARGVPSSTLSDRFYRACWLVWEECGRVPE